MDTKKARYILEIAKYKNITEAAKALYLSQPYLTKVLQGIESELGSQLFVRKRNGMSLTLAGNIYVQHLQNIVELENDMNKALSDIAEQKVGKLVIGTSALRNECFIMDVLKRFNKEYPNVQTNIYERHYKPMLKLLYDGTCDIAFLSVFGRLPKFKTEVIGQERLFLVAPTGYSLSRDFPAPGSTLTSEQIRSLSSEQFILYMEGMSITFAIDCFLKKNSITITDTLRTQSLNVGLSYALNGQSFTFVTESFIHKYQNMNPDLYYVDDPTLCLNMAIIYQENKKLSNIEKQFIQITKQYVAESQFGITESMQTIV